MAMGYTTFAAASRGRRVLLWTKGYLHEVISETSAHGCNHLTKPGRHTTERVTWFLILVGAATGAILLCLSTYSRYQTSPVVVSLERNYIDWNFVLPAAYICPDTYTDEKKLSDTATRLAGQGYASGKVEELSAFLQALANASAYVRLPALESFRGRKDLPTEGFLDLVIEASFVWDGQTPGLFPTVTEVGICYAANSIVANYTSTNKEFREMIYSGVRWPAMSISSLKKAHEYTYEGINSGYWGYIHAADSLPSLVRSTNHAAHASSSKVRTRARETYATSAARSLSPKQRGCRTEDESPPGAPRPIYTSSACREWCRALLAGKLCGCRPYFVNISQVKECDVDGLLCLNDHIDALRFLRNHTTGERLDCGCAPACNEFSFEELKVTVDFHALTQILPKPAALGQQVIEMSRVRFKRDVLFSIVDLCVSFGGAVGLCLGCSVLTLVELVYYLSIRVLLSLRSR